MSKCYVFAIGGTGARVLRSLAMLLSTGINPGMPEIVPVIIDPDRSNADFTRTIKLLDVYNEISSRFDGSADHGFFLSKIRKLHSGHILQLENTNDIEFSRFIEYSSLSRENQAMVSMLFSQKNLKSSMNVGFKGNPNIGCVVLNQIVDSPQFLDFASTFEDGDKIFIISSIFGGTGASGFPLLLKSLRFGNTFPNWSLINHAEIGAISVLPYFRVRSSEESEIDSSTFISKAVAALAYYEDNIYKAKLINALYFIGDDISNIYENNEGGIAQQNEAHLIEFLAATSVLDFMGKTFKDTRCLEIGIKDIIDSVTFDKFYSGLSSELEFPMTSMLLMAVCLHNRYAFLSSQHLNANNIMGIPLSFYDSKFMKSLRQYTKLYEDWLHELRDNVRPLSLFKNFDDTDHPFDIVQNFEEKRFNGIKKDYYLFYDRLNRAAVKMSRKKDLKLEEKFMEMFYEATQRLVREKINF